MLDKNTAIHIVLTAIQTAILVALLIYAQMLFIVTPRDLQEEVRKSNKNLQLSVEILSNQIENLREQIEILKPSKQLMQLLKEEGIANPL